VGALIATPLCLAQRRRGQRADVKERVGRPLPDVTLYNAEGEPFALMSLRGSHSAIIFGCLT
jgi:hypothetical protein